jgi:hypothetical protein
MKMKWLFVVVALGYASLGTAREKAAYPNEKLAAFVLEKLDVTSLPSSYRPKQEKGKKTFADYGFTAKKLEEKEALVEMPGGVHRLSIRILQESASGIYACVAELPQDDGKAKSQSVFLLKSKDSAELLKGRESSREFASCPVIGGSDNGTEASAYGG